MSYIQSQNGILGVLTSRPHQLSFHVGRSVGKWSSSLLLHCKQNKKILASMQQEVFKLDPQRSQTSTRESC